MSIYYFYYIYYLVRTVLEQLENENEASIYKIASKGSLSLRYTDL